jgi:small glutamine-rich tetratricopeptide repeat-containing protein alpha
VHPPSHAHYSIGDYTAAKSAFQRGLALDPTSEHLRSGLRTAESRIAPDDDIPDLVHEDAPRSSGAAPNFGGMEDALRGMMGGQGPDLANLLNNPMVAQLARQMEDGGLDSLMSNPSVVNMVT